MIEYKEPRVIAEVGCNHCGDFQIALQMIKKAAENNVYAVKFQKRTISELLTKKEYNAPHPNPRNSYGNTYGEHREFLEFDVEQHKELKSVCEQEGVEYSVSVWDLTAAKEIVEIVKPNLIKIPSPANLNEDMLEYIIENYKGEIHISLGMTMPYEEKHIFSKLNNRLYDTIVYACTSGYPIDFKDAALFEITDIPLRDFLKGIGYSGHHKGIAIDIAAYTLGAEYIERHFTLDRTWKGTDHAASLEPQGLNKLVRDLKATYEALRYKESSLLPVEEVQRKKLKKPNRIRME